jgi:NAD(P)-dependent dehydrogenase (short-subunit alcohol dehydrogenase family)
MTEAQQLAGKIAVVTGGTQGLGEAIARLFAARGASGIVFCGRNEERGAKVETALAELGAKAVFVRADLADIAQARSVIEACDRTFGRVDCLVNAAALTDRGTILSTTPELFERMFKTNTEAPFFLMQEAARIMRRERIEGAIVNILSISAHGGQSFLAAYSASKMALGTLTKSTGFALLPDRIRVNGLNIGWMDTPGEHAIQKRAHDASPGWLAGAEAGRPFGRLLKPEEVARAVAFLCSAESGMMTGSLVDFDQTILGCWDDAPFPQGRL